jgi:hypothetical protein
MSSSWTSGYLVLIVSLVCHALWRGLVIGASIEDRSKALSRITQSARLATGAGGRCTLAPDENPLTPVSPLGVSMNVTFSLGPLVSLIAGILILVMPRLLNYIVALYLIIIGVIGIFGVGASHF